jgi:hypothetical protein
MFKSVSDKYSLAFKIIRKNSFFIYAQDRMEEKASREEDISEKVESIPLTFI